MNPSNDNLFLAVQFLSELKINTIEDLANWKHFKTAKAILALAATEVSEPGYADLTGYGLIGRRV